MALCYIGIGSNLGDKQGYIDRAMEELRRSASIRLLRASSIYETGPVSDISQGKFLNGVLEVETELSAGELLKALNDIEERLGRRRAGKNGPRTMDLDILYYGDEIIDEDRLVVPHPRIQEREFVLRGLRELGKA